MKILVTGACGQLGMSLRKVLSGPVVWTDVVDAPVVKHLDITDIEAVRAKVKAENVDVIVNCAAFTNVDAAESNPEMAELLNAKAVENLAVVMKEADGLLLHISTDYVFGGDALNTPISEDQKPAPTGVYGLTKLHGEEAIQRVGCRSIILRTAWLYSEYGRNFVKTMLKLTAEKPQLKVVFDQVGTPTYAGDLAEAICRILQSPAAEKNLFFVQLPKKPNFLSACAKPTREGSEGSEGSIFHFTNEGVCSWFDFAKAIAEYAGNTGCEILPCYSSEFPSPVKRPAYSVLDKSRVKEVIGIKIPYWTESLKKCINNLQHNEL